MSEPYQPGAWPEGDCDVLHETLVVAIDALLWPQGTLLRWSTRADWMIGVLKDAGAVVTFWGWPINARLVSRPAPGWTWAMVREAALALKVAMKLDGSWPLAGGD